MRNHNLRQCWCLVITFILSAQPLAKAQSRQSRVEERRETNHKIRCTIQVEDREWTPLLPAMVRGEIENLTEGPLEIRVQPILYLSSKTSSAERDRYWAPVDLFQDGPLAIDKRPFGQNGEGVAIKAIPIKLTFNNKGKAIDFRIDARHVPWEREISSIWPSRGLFAAVEPGSYDLRLVLETDSGDSESAKAEVVIRASTSPDQKVLQELFPSAPQKAKNGDCFRGFTPRMSIYTVVEKCGRPDEEVGSGIYIFVYHLQDGATVVIGTPDLSRIDHVAYTDASGKTTSLLPGK
jgi:hypothetical protein